MAEVLIRDIPEETLAELRKAAARKGRSLEQEIVDVLAQSRLASSPPMTGEMTSIPSPGAPHEEFSAWLDSLGGRKFSPQERVAASRWFLARSGGLGEPLTAEERRDGLA
jgi:hypothetical protein